MLSQILVRRKAWWFNKVPLSVVTVLLLADGGPLGPAALLALVLVALTVCAIGNYGYALNDLYDVGEDARVARANATVDLGSSRMAAIIVGSAVVALLLALAAGGWWGLGMTVIELLLPLAYSAPPLRIKERKWLGVLADALAAHVYPATLAIIAAERLGLRQVSPLIVAALMGWAAAAGLRGILSHQLHTADRDRKAALTTVVHDRGRAQVEGFIICVLLPIEAAGFILAVVLCRTGPVLWAIGLLYLACEAYRSLDRRFVVTALRPGGQRYLPFVQESFYKAWGPIALALDAMRVDLAFGLLVPIYAVLFWPHLKTEASRLRQLARAIRRPLLRV